MASILLSPARSPHKLIEISRQHMLLNALHGLELGLNSVPVGLDRLGVNMRDWIHEEQRVIHGEKVQARNVANPIVGPPFVTVHHRTRLDVLLDDGQQCCSIPSLHQLHIPYGGGH